MGSLWDVATVPTRHLRDVVGSGVCYPGSAGLIWKKLFSSWSIFPPEPPMHNSKAVNGRVRNRYSEKLFSITIPIPSLFSIFDYRPIMQQKISVSR
jgi:hypothetical protein